MNLFCISSIGKLTPALLSEDFKLGLVSSLIYYLENGHIGKINLPNHPSKRSEFWR